MYRFVGFAAGLAFVLSDQTSARINGTISSSRRLDLSTYGRFSELTDVPEEPLVNVHSFEDDAEDDADRRGFRNAIRDFIKGHSKHGSKTALRYDSFDIIRELQDASKGKFQYAYCKDLHMYVALRTFTQDERAKGRVERELITLKECSHQFIVEYVGHTINPNNEIVLVYKFAGNVNLAESLLQYVKYLHHRNEPPVKVGGAKFPSGIPTAYVRFYMAQMILAAKYMKENNIMHRGLRLQSFFVGEDGYLRLANFDMAGKIYKKAYSQGGAVPFMPPEMLAVKYMMQKLVRQYQLDGKGSTIEEQNAMARAELKTKAGSGFGYDSSVDLWAIGIMGYEMMTRESPINENYEKSVKKATNANKIDFRSVSQFRSTSEMAVDLERHVDANNLIDAMLNPDPKERLGFDKIMKHPFFSSIDWKTVESKREPSPPHHTWDSSVKLPSRSRTCAI